MTETPPLCDRCGAITVGRGIVAEHKDGRKLVLCPVHEREHRPVLEKQKDWTITPAPPALTARAARTGEEDRAICGICRTLAPSRLVQPNTESKMVRITHCGRCDTRTCNYNLEAGGKCGAVLADRTAQTCPQGHSLMGTVRA